MAKYLIENTETYRVDSEEEVNTLIQEAKDLASEEGYILKSCNYTLKEKKSKGEVIDSAFLVKLTKTYNSFWECEE